METRERHERIWLRVFACGEGEEVVLGKHLGQTAVVCDHRRGNTTETSDLDDVDLLVKEACIVNVEWICPYKTKTTRITHQYPR